MAIFKANYLRRTEPLAQLLAPERKRPRLMEINIASLAAAGHLERLNQCAGPVAAPQRVSITLSFGVDRE